jgi:hypothetical protein
MIVFGEELLNREVVIERLEPKYIRTERLERL